MPRKYSDGGRAPAGSSGPAGGLPPSARSLKERVGALRNLPAFVAMVWRTSRLLTASSLLLRLVRALLPVATLYIGKLIIDEVVAAGAAAGQPGDAAATGWTAGLLNRLILLLAAEFALAVLADVLGRVVSLIDSLLSERVTNASSVRLMEHAATLDLEDFEDAEFQDQLERARRQTSGRMTLMSQLFGQAQDIVTVVSFAAGLIVYAPWLIVLLLVALVPAFLGEAHFNAQSYSLDYLPHAGAARARLCAPDRGERRDRQGSEDLRPQRLPDRPLPPPCRRFLRRQPPAGGAARRLGRPVHRDRHDRLLPRLCLYRLAHAGRRILDRRPDLPRRLVPAPAHPAGGAAGGLLDHGEPGALSRRPVLLLRGRAGNPLAARRRCPFRSRSATASSSRMSASSIRAPSAGRCAI